MKNKMLQAVIKMQCDKQGIFGEKVGFSELQVSQVVHGRKKLTAKEKAHWAKVLNTPLRLLFPDQGEEVR